MRERFFIRKIFSRHHHIEELVICLQCEGVRRLFNTTAEEGDLRARMQTVGSVRGKKGVWGERRKGGKRGKDERNSMPIKRTRTLKVLLDGNSEKKRELRIVL